MEVKPENRAMKDCQRIFVHMMVYEGLDRLEAYSQSHNEEITNENMKSLKGKAARLFYSPHINKYYHALIDEIKEKEMQKGLWTREVATKKLVKLIEKAEEDIYDKNRTLTMARLNAIVLPAKELNLMNGFNQSNVNVDGAIVQIVGEEDIPD